MIVIKSNLIHKNSNPRELIFGILLSLIIISLPFSKLTSNYLTLLLFLTWVIFKEYKDLKFSLFSDLSKISWILLYFFIYLVSFLFGENPGENWGQIEKRIPFLVVPLVVYTISEKYDIRSILLHVLIISMVLTIIISSFLIIKLYIIHQNQAQSYSLSFYQWYLPKTINFHPPYWAAYIAFSSFCSLHFLLEERKKKKKLIYGIYFILSNIFLVFLASRTALISHGFLTILFLLFFHKTAGKNLSSKLAIFSIVLAAIITIYSSPFLKKKLLMFYGSQERLELWNSGLLSFTQNPIFGHGLSNYLEVIQNNFNNLGYVASFEHKFNLHNQFLTDSVKFGIIGFLVLTSIFLFPLISSFKKQDYLLSYLILLIVLCSMTESFLERQKGIMFFCIFYPLLVSNLNSINAKN